MIRKCAHHFAVQAHAVVLSARFDFVNVPLAWCARRSKRKALHALSVDGPRSMKWRAVGAAELVDLDLKAARGHQCGVALMRKVRIRKSDENARIVVLLLTTPLDPQREVARQGLRTPIDTPCCTGLRLHHVPVANEAPRIPLGIARRHLPNRRVGDVAERNELARACLDRADCARKCTCERSKEQNARRHDGVRGRDRSGRVDRPVEARQATGTCGPPQ